MSERFDIHQHVTNQIIDAIEGGTDEFQLPWHRATGAILRPTNIASEALSRGEYSCARRAAETKRFTSGIWGTYRQWAELGAQVRKGEKSTDIDFYKQIVTLDAEEDDTTRLVDRATPVFAAEQVEGYSPQPAELVTPSDLIDSAEGFVAASGASIAHGGDKTYYRPSTDSTSFPTATPSSALPRVVPLNPTTRHWRTN